MSKATQWSLSFRKFNIYSRILYEKQLKIPISSTEFLKYTPSHKLHSFIA